MENIKSVDYLAPMVVNCDGGSHIVLVDFIGGKVFELAAPLADLNPYHKPINQETALEIFKHIRTRQKPVKVPEDVVREALNTKNDIGRSRDA